MGPDLSAAVRTRCPACAAAVRPDAPWCTQCYADLRAPEPPAPEPLRPAAPVPADVPDAGGALATAAPEPVAPSVVQAAAAGEQPDGATWPCTTCGAANALDRDACAACGAGFLSALRAGDEPLLVLPVVGDLGAMSRGQRLGLAGGVVVAVLLLVALLGLLLG